MAAVLDDWQDHMLLDGHITLYRLYLIANTEGHFTKILLSVVALMNQFLLSPIRRPC